MLTAKIADVKIRIGRTSPSLKGGDNMSAVIDNDKRSDRQNSILGVALKVFSEEGFRNTDVQDIADLAGVGKGTVYRHFGNKEDLFLAVSRYCLENLGTFVEQYLGGVEAFPELVAAHGTVEALRRIAVGCAEFYQQCPAAVEIMIQERAEFRDKVVPSHLIYRTETRGGLDELIQHAIEAGELRQVDVNEATNAFGDLLFGSAVNGCLEGGHTKLVERVEHAVDILLHGLVARGGSDNRTD